jgi:hypothetical protein
VEQPNTHVSVIVANDYIAELPNNSGNKKKSSSSQREVKAYMQGYERTAAMRIETTFD